MMTQIPAEEQEDRRRWWLGEKAEGGGGIHGGCVGRNWGTRWKEGLRFVADVRGE